MPNPYKTENYRKNEVHEDKKADIRLDETTDPQNAMLADHPPDAQAAGDDGYLVNDNSVET